MKTTLTPMKISYCASAWALCFLIALPLMSQAETVVTNNVSVSSDSSGGKNTSHAEVHTTINGETVEDVSLASDDGEPISYISSHTNNDEVVVSVNASTTPLDQEKQQELKSLLERLVALLTLYVSKLSL